MLMILGQRNFTLLWCAGLISGLGDWVLGAALPVYIYTRTGSALATGITFIVETLPMLLLSSFTGVYADLWPRRRIMVIADVARLLLLCALFLVPISGSLLPIYIVAGLEMTFTLFFGPAQNALLPDLVASNDLAQANSLNSISNNLARLIGPLVGGALLTLGGFNSVVLVDIASYMFSAVLLLCIVTPVIKTNNAQSPMKTEVDIQQHRRFWKEWHSGIRLLSEHVWLQVFFVAMSFTLFAQGMMNILNVVFVEQVLHAGPQGYGLLMSAQGIGGLVAGFFIGYISKHLSALRLFSHSLLSIGLLILIQVNFPLFPIAFTVYILAGMAVVGLFVGISTILQGGVDPAYRGRIFGILGTTQTLFSLGGMTLASMLGNCLGSPLLLNLSALLWLVAGLLAVLKLRRTPQIREQEVGY